MAIQNVLLCLICVIVYPYEEITRKKWFSSLFFGLAILIAYSVKNDFWIKVAPLFFSFSFCRLIFYSLPITKQWPLNLGLTAGLLYILLKVWQIPLPPTSWSLEANWFFWVFLSLSIVFSSVGLLLYFRFRDFDLSLIPIPPIQKKYVGLMIFAGSVINSLREEIPYRWLLMLPLAALTDPITAILIQGVIFGAMHFHDGLTNKWLGFLMTTLFGLGMGYVTFQSGSIAPAILVHAVVDMILLWIVVKRYIPETYFKVG